jgi:glycosyltransferase involved in cell wall biosynthesis
MKVLILSNSLTGGGAERSTNLLANGLHDLGVNLGLITTNVSTEDFIEVKVKHFCLGVSNTNSVFQLFRASIKLLIHLVRIRPRTIIVSCELPEFLISLQPYFCKLIVIEHTTTPWKNRLTLGKFVRYLLKRRGAQWVSVYESRTVWPFLIQKVHFIRNMTTEIKLEATPDLAKFGTASRLIFIGRLDENKRPNLGLNVAKAAKLPILMIGDGPLRLSLESMALQEQISAHFVGFVKNPWDLVRVGDLLIVPSLNEGDGLVVVEAITRNFPIILSDVPDLRRFGFPSELYAGSEEDFVKSVLTNTLDKLLVPAELVLLEIERRKPETILVQWLDLLVN